MHVVLVDVLGEADQEIVLPARQRPRGDLELEEVLGLRGDEGVQGAADFDRGTRRSHRFELPAQSQARPERRPAIRQRSLARLRRAGHRWQSGSARDRYMLKETIMDEVWAKLCLIKYPGGIEASRPSLLLRSAGFPTRCWRRRRR